MKRAIGLAVLIGLVVAAPAGADIDGTVDGVRHPYVGAVDGRALGAPAQFGQGS